MEKEIWKPLPEWEQDYEVSSFGRIRTIDRTITTTDGIDRHLRQKYIIPKMDQHGYIQYQLKSGEKRKLMKAHRAVAMAFIENPENKPCVNHIDNNVRNNNVENLEWCTRKENTRWMMVQGRADRTREWLQHLDEGLEKMRKPVVGVSIATGEEMYFRGVNDTAKYGFMPSCVSLCCNGISKKHKGYRWRFAWTGKS